MPIDFWKGTGGVPGDFSYGTIHLSAVIILILITFVMCLAGAKMSKASQRKVIVAAAVISIVFEIFWRIIFWKNGEKLIDLYPFYPCNLAGVLVPLIALSKNKILKELFYVFAFVGGVITFVYPQGIFTNEYLSFGILKSILQHTAIIFIPVFEYATGHFKPKLKYVWLSIIGLFIHLFNSEYMPKLLGKTGAYDYIFLRSGLPFVIDGIPQVFILGTLAVIVMIALYMMLDTGGSRRLFKRRRRRK